MNSCGIGSECPKVDTIFQLDTNATVCRHADGANLPYADAINQVKAWKGRLKPPKSWAPEFGKKFLERTSKGPVKALKAHEARVAIDAGFFAVVANSPGPTPQEARRRRNFAAIQGNAAEFARQLYSKTVHMHGYMDRLEQLTQDCVQGVEDHCSYYMNSLTTHLLRHLPEQVKRNGPAVETSMIVFESALGMNKNLKMNMVHIAASILQTILRVRMIAQMFAVLKLMQRDRMGSDGLFHPRERMNFDLIPKRRVALVGQGKPHTLRPNQLIWLRRWMMHGHPECELFLRAYVKYKGMLQDEIQSYRARRAGSNKRIRYCEADAKKKAHVNPSRWLGREPTALEYSAFLHPEDCPVVSVRRYKKCLIGREEFQTKHSHLRNAAHHHWGLKLEDVEGGDSTLGTTKVDMFGILNEIFEVKFAPLPPSLESRTFTLFLADWYSNASVEHDPIAKVAMVKPETFDNSEPFVLAASVCPMVYIGPHPYRADVLVVYDRHADFLHRATRGYAPLPPREDGGGNAPEADAGGTAAGVGDGDVGGREDPQVAEEEEDADLADSGEDGEDAEVQEATSSSDGSSDGDTANDAEDDAGDSEDGDGNGMATDSD